MCCSRFRCGIITAVLGVILVIVSVIISFVVVPMVIDNLVLAEVALENNTEAMDRFVQIPFPLHFRVRLFNITNRDEVLTGGVPVVTEMGPYVYKLNHTRFIESYEADIVTYRIRNLFEFDPEASAPYTEDDLVTVVNVPYHGILQMAEKLFPVLMGALNLGLSGVFGANNGPLMTVRVRDFLFDGIPICKDAGLIGEIACTQIRTIGASVKNLEEQEDGSLLFTILKYKDNNPSDLYEVFRGLEDPSKLGIIKSFNGSQYIDNWATQVDENGATVPGICNMVNGSDSAIYPPFVDRDKPVYAINLDICRSVTLKYQYDTEYEGIPVVRYAVNEWFLDNHEGCFCLNTTPGITQEDGCLLKGAMELYSCVGALLVLSYPHFLYADPVYQNGVIGMAPVVEDHRIFVDLDPYTGTVIRGNKRAQFNIFMRPVQAIPDTQNLKVTLAPIFWVEEGSNLPEDLTNMIKNRLVTPLSIVSIVIPVLISLSGAVAIIGIILAIWAKRREKSLSK